MARTNRAQAPQAQTRHGNNGEATTLLDSSDPTNPDNVPQADLSIRDGQYAGSAVTEEDLRDPGPPVRKFTVINGGMVQTHQNGPRARLTPGKIIDELNYDIALLKRQGIKLKIVEAVEENSEDELDEQS